MSDERQAPPNRPGQHPDEPGVAEGSPGGAVSGEIGVGEAVSDPGMADLAGDADISGGDDPLRTQVAGGDSGAEEEEA